ncbi:hypothetical protein BGX27_008445 [Mortierella sp. AM989]|nr:hypothetical protein BGX27_008445 [Mortierella sp. AM989]
MKFSTVAVAASLAVIASAQKLGIGNPTLQTTWTSGKDGYISWTGSCGNLGNASHAVPVQLMNGPAGSVAYVTDLGTIDCSDPIKNSISITVPGTEKGVSSGTYSLQILTQPDISYSSTFNIKNAEAPAPSAPPQQTTAPPPKATEAAANALVSGSMVAFLGTAVAAVQFLL